MRNFTITLIVIAAMIFTLTGCDKKQTVEKLEDLATELRIHNVAIHTTANEFHATQRMADADHLRILTAANGFSKSLDLADAAINTAKAGGAGERRSMLDYAERVINVEAFGSFMRIVEAVIAVPPDVKERLEQIINLMRITFAAIRSLMAEAGIAIRQEAIYAE